MRRMVSSYDEVVGDDSSRAHCNDNGVCRYVYKTWGTITRELRAKGQLVDAPELLKIDIEGAEFVVLPSLIESGAACLIDELYLECHTSDHGHFNMQRVYADCIALLRAFEGIGTVAHIWF